MYLAKFYAVLKFIKDINYRRGQHTVATQRQNTMSTASSLETDDKPKGCVLFTG